MVERLLIDRLGHRGDGIADGPDGPIYVPGTLPGETVEVEDWPGHPDRRQLLNVEMPSAERIAPICPHFGVCGGCALQHWQTAAYRAWKRDLVVGALHQAGIAAPVADLIDAHGEGRRRVVFHARRGTHDVLEVGFSAARAHHVIAIDRCPILAKSLDGALEAAWAMAEVLDPANKPLDIAVTATDAGLDVDVRGSGPLPADLMTALARVAARQNLARLTRHGELIAQARAPTLRIGTATVRLPPAAFLQATAEGEAMLARLVLDSCAGAGNIADLFAGVGPFALRLAALRARVCRRSRTKPPSPRSSAPPRPPPASSRSRPSGAICSRIRCASTSSTASTPSCSIRRARAPRRRRASLPQAPFRRSSRCRAIPATFARDMRLLLRRRLSARERHAGRSIPLSAHVEIVARLEK